MSIETLSPRFSMPADASVEHQRLRADLDRFLRGVERRALRVAELSCRQHEDALEVVQETMLAFVRSYARVSEHEWPLLFWRMLENRLADHHRRRQVRGRWMVWFAPKPEWGQDDDPLAALPDAAEPGPLSRLSDEQALEALQLALRELPTRQRQAFLLRVWEGLDVAQTARAMGVSEGSVKTHLFRAMQQLRTRLEVHHEA